MAEALATTGSLVGFTKYQLTYWTFGLESSWRWSNKLAIIASKFLLSSHCRLSKGLCSSFRSYVAVKKSLLSDIHGCVYPYTQLDHVYNNVTCTRPGWLRSTQNMLTLTVVASASLKSTIHKNGIYGIIYSFRLQSTITVSTHRTAMCGH